MLRKCGLHFTSAACYSRALQTRFFHGSKQYELEGYFITRKILKSFQDRIHEHWSGCSNLGPYCLQYRPPIRTFADKSCGCRGIFVDLSCFCSVLCLLCLCACLFICALGSPAGKGLTSWLSFVVSTMSLSLSHWYPGSGVVLDCIDFWSLHPYLLWYPFFFCPILDACSQNGPEYEIVVLSALLLRHPNSSDELAILYELTRAFTAHAHMIFTCDMNEGFI